MTGFEPATPWSQTRCSSQTEPHPELNDRSFQATSVFYKNRELLSTINFEGIYINFEGIKKHGVVNAMLFGLLLNLDISRSLDLLNFLLGKVDLEDSVFKLGFDVLWSKVIAYVEASLH